MERIRLLLEAPCDSSLTISAKVMRNLVLAIVLAAAAPSTEAQGESGAIEATTRGGDKVLLHPNGRWEYVDSTKAADAKRISSQFPENQGCPPGSQGGLLGIGRCIPPGDRDYNRGTLNPGRR